MKRTIPFYLTVLAAMGILLGAGAASAADTYTFSGRGTAHGVGLDMSGVQALANQGKGYQEILKTYYSGVNITDGYQGEWMRIGLGEGGAIRVTADKPYLVFTDDAPHTSPTVRVAAGTVTSVSYVGGKYVTKVANGGSWTKARHTWFSPEGGGRLKFVNNGRQYRALIEARHSSASGKLWGINVINIEDYVKGIAEEPNSWPTEGQRTLAVAARTYALNKKFYSDKWANENFDLDATLGSQYYLGFDAERSNLAAATDYTRGKVVTYGGKVIVAAYHGNSGGHTESMENVWGGSPGDYPYLRGIPTPWTPVYNWGPKTFTKAQLQEIFNRQVSTFVGTLYSIDFSNRTPSGRLRTVKLHGSGGVKEISGYSQFAAWLGFPSALIDIGTPKDQWDWEIALLNPGERAANVKLIFMFPKSGKKAIARTVRPNGRATVAVDGLITAGSAGVKIESDRPIVAERTNYFRYSSEINGAHGSLGSKVPRKRWYVADGRTEQNSESWISVLNPRSTASLVTATFMPGQGRRIKKTIKVGPQSRGAFYVNGIKGLKSTPVPAVVIANGPVIVERATYLNSAGFRGGHSSRASESLSKTWYFAEGFTGAGFTNRLQIFNPSNRKVGVTVWLSKSNGDQYKKRVTIDPLYRKSILLNRWVSGHAFGIRVLADAPVAAERTVYFKNSAQTGVYSTVGSPILTKRQYFAGGDTAPGYTEFLTVLNPQNNRANLTIEYLKEGGGLLKKTNRAVPRNSRGTFVVGHSDEAGADQSVGIRLTSDQPIVSERVSYFTSSAGGVSMTGGHATVGAVSPAKNWYFSEGVTQ